MGSEMGKEMGIAGMEKDNQGREMGRKRERDDRGERRRVGGGSETEVRGANVLVCFWEKKSDKILFTSH